MSFLVSHSRLFPLVILLLFACGYVTAVNVSYGIAIIILGLIILLLTTNVKMFIYSLIIFLSVVGLFSVYLTSIEFSLGTAFQFNALGLLNIGIATVGLGYIMIKHKKISFKRTKFSKLLILYLAFSLLTIPFSINLREALSRWVTIATPIMVFFIVQNSIRTPIGARKIIKLIAIMAMIPMGSGFHQLFTGEGTLYTAGTDSYRLIGLGGEPNAYAMYLGFLFCLGLSQYVFADSKNRIWWGIYVLSLFVLIIFTYTRIVWISVIAVITMLLFMQKRWVSLAATLGIVIFLSFTPFIQNRIGRFSDIIKVVPQLGEKSAVQAGPLNSLTARSYMWNVTMKNLVLKNGMAFLIGNGVGSTFAWGKSHPDVLFNWSPHNEYFVTIADTGVIGLLIFLSVFILIMKKFIRSYYASRYPLQKSLCLSSIFLTISFLLFCLTDNILGLWSISIFYWVPIGLAVAVCKEVD